MSSAGSHPTTQELARRFADLREAAGLDLDAFASRSRLDPRIIEELESGTRVWTFDDLQAYADALEIRLSVIFAEWDAADRS
jgi:transcriptional regulator with XRE-family HTH domain